VDIKPGSEPNLVNANKKKGGTPVAILTTEDFDAATVDVATVGFGPNGTRAQHDGHMEDVDGDDDLLLHFSTQDTGIQQGDTEACVTGNALGGVLIYGCDTINILGK